jgi:hypothetical protein
LDRLVNDSGSAAIGVFTILLHGRTHDVRTRASDRVPHRIQLQPGWTTQCPSTEEVSVGRWGRVAMGKMGRSSAYSSTIFERHDSELTVAGSAPVTPGSSSVMRQVVAEQQAAQLHVKTPSCGALLFIEKASTSARRTN